MPSRPSRRRTARTAPRWSHARVLSLRRQCECVNTTSSMGMAHTSLLLKNVGLTLLGLDGTENDVHFLEGSALGLGNKSRI